MRSLELNLKLAGLALMLLGVAHAFFGSRFNWKQEFEKVSLLNRQIFYVHTFFIALVVTLLGILAFFYTAVLLEPTQLARVVLCGIVIFWGCRLAVQFFGYDASLWKGDRFNTWMHILLSLLWLYLVSVFAWALWHQVKNVSEPASS